MIIPPRLSLVFWTCCLIISLTFFFDLLLIGRTHRVEPILGEAELGEHLDGCIGIRIQSNEHLSSLLLLDRNSPFFRALGRLGNSIALPLREGRR